MSDGTISQDEIDALLAGGGMGDKGGAQAMDLSIFEDYSKTLIGSLAAGLQTTTGVPFEAGEPVVELVNGEQFSARLPDTVVTVKADFSAGIQGPHSYVLTPEFARKITDLVNKEEGADLDDMALSIVSEAVSQHTAAEITELSKLGKFPGLACNPAETGRSPKGEVQFPPDTFVLFSFPVTVQGASFTLWETVSQDAARAMGAALGQEAPSAPPAGAPGGKGPSGYAGGAITPGANVPNVQGLQYPILQTNPNLTPGEQANIGLLMDVPMEMTVELGRTRKQIKEILGMGEGTIIELDKLAGEPVDILVNHKPIAKGEVVVIDENFGVRVTEILSPMERVDLG
ncbi:MAG: flagellar motor switch protein FliN [Spirochaetaceae bacterium]|jgi:flagellar motor switch protein FliN/FliY|nr:flagellar motor switch protein FliN [Spirochaetaceae bacterium]